MLYIMEMDDITKTYSPEIAEQLKLYNYELFWSEEDNDWVAKVDAFPSVNWLESEPDEAVKGVFAVAAECLQILAEDGDKWPNPTVI